MWKPPLAGGGFAGALWDAAGCVGNASSHNAPDSCQSSPRTLIAYIHPPLHRPRRRFNNRYSIEVDGELIATDELSACRVLLRRGITGTLKVHDATSGKLRLTLDIELAAGLVVKESAHGPIFRKFREDRP
jgi:hypothetical protein